MARTDILNKVGPARHFVETSAGVALRGQRCRQCGHVDFPERPICPACGRTELEMLPIGRLGVVRDSTVVHVGPPGFGVPHIQAFVATAEGPTVFAMLDAPCDEPVPPGTLVELATVGSEGGCSGRRWIYRQVADRKGVD